MQVPVCAGECEEVGRVMAAVAVGAGGNEPGDAEEHLVWEGFELHGRIVVRSGVMERYEFVRGGSRAEDLVLPRKPALNLVLGLRASNML